MTESTRPISAQFPLHAYYALHVSSEEEHASPCVTHDTRKWPLKIYWVKVLLKSVISVPVYLRQIGLDRNINTIHDVRRILLMSVSQFDGIILYRMESCYVIKRITIFELWNLLRASSLPAI